MLLIIAKSKERSANIKKVGKLVYGERYWSMIKLFLLINFYDVWGWNGISFTPHSCCLGVYILYWFGLMPM